MGDLVLTPGGTFAAAPVGFTGSSGNYWLGRADPGFPRYRIQDVFAPSVDGAAERRDGFEGRDLRRLEVVFVAGSADSCWGALNTALEAMKNVAVSAAFGGVTYPACALADSEVLKGPKKTGQGGMYRLHVALAFHQKRLA